MQVYLHDVGQYDLLTAEQERILAQRMRKTMLQHVRSLLKETCVW